MPVSKKTEKVLTSTTSIRRERGDKLKWAREAGGVIVGRSVEKLCMPGQFSVRTMCRKKKHRNSRRRKTCHLKLVAPFINEPRLCDDDNALLAAVVSVRSLFWQAPLAKSHSNRAR